MYLVDTNILIYYLAGEPNCVAFVQRHADQILISAISVIEVLSYNFADDGLTIAKQFLSSFECFMMKSSCLKLVSNAV